ncbi:MAG: purine nucleoside phosphorylase [Herpetosiphonaceae bacterium]|nr:MAG: purine nucleoside phosphorylase [Herpetosiphonaceae bacterium]
MNTPIMTAPGQAPENLYDFILEAAAYIAGRSSLRPELLLILGSGLSGLISSADEATTIPYGEIPYFPRSTIEGHKGELVLCRLENLPVAVMRGRFHYYEGYDFWQTTFPVRVARALGASTLIVTNAAGGLRAEWQVGDLMRIRDHIFFPGLAGMHPLRGFNDQRLGLRFPAMLDAYDPMLGQLAHEAAEEVGATLREGVYAMIGGPSFETAAEMRLLRAVGVDAVGMSTVPEVIVARHGGMRVLGISLITNLALPDGQPANHEEVLEAGETAKPRFTALIRSLLKRLQGASEAPAAGQQGAAD